MSVSLLREAIDEAQIPRGRELTPAGVAPEARTPLVAVLGLGSVGLTTALALRRAGKNVVGIDVSERFGISDESLLSEADAVMICVPTPVGEYRNPDLTALRAACAAVCRQARRGQTIVLTSTSYVGTTRDLLVEPLAELGFELGTDICVACSPESIHPANTAHLRGTVRRVLGAGSELCAERARAVVSAIAPVVHVVSSAEAAEALGLSPAAIVDADAVRR